jgi:hypothetical protein
MLTVHFIKVWMNSLEKLGNSFEVRLTFAVVQNRLEMLFSYHAC